MKTHSLEICAKFGWKLSERLPWLYSLFFVQVVPVMLHLLTSISSVRLYIPKDLRPFDNRQLMLKSIQVQNAAILKQRYSNWGNSTESSSGLLPFLFFTSKHFCP